MTSQQGLRACFDAVTVNAARIMQLTGYGQEPGYDASFVLLQARGKVEAIRLRATRLKVWKKGRLLAESAPAKSVLHLPGRGADTSFARGL